MSSSPGIKLDLSNVWCPLLARHAPQFEQQQPPPEHHVPISVPDCGIMWHQPDEEAFDVAQSAPAHYLQLMSMAGKRVQLARSKPQPTPDVALCWPAEAAASSAAKASAPCRPRALSISVHIVSVRFDPHALCPQLAMAIANVPLPLPVPVPVPAPAHVNVPVPVPNSALASTTRAYRQRKFYLLYTKQHS